MVRESADGATARALPAVGRCSVSATTRKATSQLQRFERRWECSMAIVNNIRTKHANSSTVITETLPLPTHMPRCPTRGGKEAP